MNTCYIKLSFKEQRIFVKTYDCGVFVSLSSEPEIVTSLPPNQPANLPNILQQNERECVYDFYQQVDGLDEKYLQNALKHFRQHYPEGYVVINNQFLEMPNAIQINLQNALEDTKVRLQRAWGAIALTTFGFNKHVALPLEMQNNILSKVSSHPQWQSNHLIDREPITHQPYDENLTVKMNKLADKHFEVNEDQQTSRHRVKR